MSSALGASSVGDASAELVVAVEADVGPGGVDSLCVQETSNSAELSAANILDVCLSTGINYKG